MNIKLQTIKSYDLTPAAERGENINIYSNWRKPDAQDIDLIKHAIPSLTDNDLKNINVADGCNSDADFNLSNDRLLIIDYDDLDGTGCLDIISVFTGDTVTSEYVN